MTPLRATRPVLLLLGAAAVRDRLSQLLAIH